MSNINMTKEELIEKLVEIKATLAEEMKKRQEPVVVDQTELKEANKRLEYRVKHLIKALEEQDKEIEQLKKQIK
ncbi:Seven tm domain protein [Entamoeba marina]